MERFIRRAKIANFTELLKAETDPDKREVLQALLSAEKTKLAALGKGGEVAPAYQHFRS